VTKTPMEAINYAATMALEDDPRIWCAALRDIRRRSQESLLESSPQYGPHGAVLEDSVQDAVDLMWYSFPDAPDIIIDEWLDGRMVASWWVPNPVASEQPPVASPYHRQEV
jgi:hypothetical protein